MTFLGRAFWHIQMEADIEMDDFMQTCLDGAKRNLEENGGVAGLCFFRPKVEPDLGKDNVLNKPAMGVIPMNTAPNKDAWYRLIGRAVKEIGVKFTVLVVEAWVSVDPELDEKGEAKLMPSQDPKRMEAIAINGVQYDDAGLIMRSKQITVPFERDGNEYVYLEAIAYDDSDDIVVYSALADATARSDLA